MSWKNLATVAACALLATPALAQPSLQITSGGLNGDGNWLWNVEVTPDDGLFVDNPPQGVGGSVAVEIGIEATGAGLLGVTFDATNFEEENPGTALGGSFPAGAGVNTAGNFASVSLGSTYFTSGGGKAMLEVITEGPSTNGSLSSSLVVSGAYAGEGRIAQAAANYNGILGTAARTAKEADANVDGNVDGLDLSTLATNFGLSDKHYGTADFNGDGTVDGLDLSLLATHFGQSGGVNTPLDVTGVAAGSGGAASAAVPEPASIALAGLALLAGLGLVRRK